jgi:hydrogenase maturation protein HypF
MFAEIIDDIKQNISPGIISAKFHNTISEIIIAGVHKLYSETGLKNVVLSGGTFQNKYLLERTENNLKESGFQVFCNCVIPCNDGGISLGQLAIAARRREKPPSRPSPKG